MVKMNAVHPNWKGEGIFKRNIEISGIFAHRETGEIILETKEGRYRLTITNMISQDGFALSKMAKHAQKACKKDLKKWADAKFEQVKSFNSDW